MAWNWQHPDWPNFAWNRSRLQPAEDRFIEAAGVLVGVHRHLNEEDAEQATVEGLTLEAMQTARIEGERLERNSVRSSIRRELGLATDSARARPAERGVAELMTAVFRSTDQPLTHQVLCEWHGLLMRSRFDAGPPGAYRTHAEPMRIVSQAGRGQRVHFEAPPSDRVPEEMDRFLSWFTATAPRAGADRSSALPALTRAGLSHLYFESIHPFEDGNGRIGRAVAEKALAQALRRPSLCALSATIQLHRREYYAQLEAANHGDNACEVSDWLAWFGGIVLEAQRRALARIEFVIDKSRLLDRFRSTLNPRQSAALARVAREGPEGFEGGLSASNYVAITRASTATASRDLADMVRQGALVRTGQHRHARYHLPIPLRPTPRIRIDADGRVIEGP